MKSFKVAITSWLLSFCTLGVVYTQTAPKLAFSVNSGITSSGLPVQFGIKSGLGDHLTFNAHIGNAPWKIKDKANKTIEQNVTLKNLKIRGQFAYGLDVRAYTNDNQSGFYGGLGYFRQQIKTESSTELRTPRSSVGFARNAQTFTGFLFGGLLDVITGIDRKQTIDRVDKTTINAISIHTGYAVILEDNSRLEFGLTYFNRTLKDAQYSIPTFDGLKTFDIADKIGSSQAAAEIRYIVPIL